MLDKLPPPSFYGLLTLAGLLLGILAFRKRRAEVPGWGELCLAGFGGAIIGAKAAFLAGEGWIHAGTDLFWPAVFGGKSILGGLAGGYAGVELAKHWMGVKMATGDHFASIVPFSIALGRVGCWTSGCCQGQLCAQPAWWTLTDPDGLPRWPAAPAEIAFNLLFLAVLRPLAGVPSLRGQHFHLYLASYGLFRFAHEFARDTPRPFAALPVSAYGMLALGLAGLGAAGFWRRARRAEIMKEKGVSAAS